MFCTKSQRFQAPFDVKHYCNLSVCLIFNLLGNNFMLLQKKNKQTNKKKKTLCDYVKGRTIRKLMGVGGGGGRIKNIYIRAREN